MILKFMIYEKPGNRLSYVVRLTTLLDYYICANIVQKIIILF